MTIAVDLSGVVFGYPDLEYFEFSNILVITIKNSFGYFTFRIMYICSSGDSHWVRVLTMSKAPDLDITEDPLDFSNFLQSVGDEDLGQNMLRPRT